MTTVTSQRQPEVTGRTVVVTGGGVGIVLERARSRRPELRPARITSAPSARARRAPAGRLEQIDHVMAAAAGPAFR